MADLKEKIGGPPFHVAAPQSSPESLHLGQFSHTISVAQNHLHLPIIEILHAQHQTAENIHVAAPQSSPDTRISDTISVEHNRHYPPILKILHAQHQTAENIHRGLEWGELGTLSMRAVMGGRAFRKYYALSNTIGLNKAGNLRGMVASPKWRTLFRYTSDAYEFMENIGLLAGLAAGITEAAPEIEAIVKASDPMSLTSLKMSALASTIAQRALLGIVPFGAHALYRSLEGWCMLAALLPVGKVQSGASQCIRTLKQADTLVQTGFRAVTDTSNQSKAVWWVIDVVVSSSR